MIKVEVTKEFTLKNFEELKNINRKCRDEQGKLFVGDTFECEKDMCDYLMGQNKLNRAVVQIVEVIPEKEEIKEVLKELSTLDTINKVKKPIKKKSSKK